MMTAWPARCALALALALAAGCDSSSPAASPDAAVRYAPAPFAPTDATRAYCRADDVAIEARITAMLATLTVDEKVALLHGAALSVVEGSWRVRGNAAVGLPGLRMVDGPRGVSAVTRLRATVFPVAMMRGATWSPDLERRVGEAIADEVRSAGADVVLAPTMNILRHPRWGRAQETYSEDTHHLGAMAAAFIEGAQSRGVIASAKHFAANSIEGTRHTVDVTLDARTLREVYLPHFRRAVVDAHVGSVMSAYNKVNGAWCDQSVHLLREVLKTEWGFAGFVESDWVFGTHGDVDSLRAGLDIEMPSALHFGRLADAVAAGDLSVHTLDDAVRRVARAQLCFGLDARPRVADDPSQRLTPAHLSLAREVAQRGVVLLRNETARGAPALPFGAAVRNLVVLGRNADVENIGDRGSSSVLAGDVSTALEGLQARAGVAVTHLRGATLDAEGERAVRAADAVVIVTGLDASDEGEAEIGAGDRRSLALRDDEAALIRAAAALNDRVVVVLEGGAAITPAGWRDDVEAVLFAFYPGAQGGLALADVLFGDVAPSGRLPFSIPAREADLPPFDNTSPTVNYGYFHGYRHLAHEGVAAAYPFGFGLGYTAFAYSDLAVAPATIRRGDTLTATVTVTNRGAVRGVETVQLYVGARGSSVPRAPRDLRAFTQVELAAGASARVTLTLRADDLAWWNEASRSWALEPVDYAVIAAPDAAATGLAATVRAE